MKIPNSTIEAKAENGAAFVKIEPAYYAQFYRRVWGIRLTAENLKVTTLGEDAHASARYHDIESLDAEKRHLCARFGVEMFDMVFPGGEEDLRAAVKKEIDKEVARAQRVRATSAVPHQSYMDFGLSDLDNPPAPNSIDTEAVRKDKTDAIDKYNRENKRLAIALQTAGFPNRNSCIGVEIMRLCEAGISPEIAVKLAEGVSKTEAETVVKDEIPYGKPLGEVTDESIATANAG